MAKKFLVDNGIKYREFNIVEDKVAREEMKTRCHSLGVPTICFDDEVVVGSMKQSLEKS